MVKWFAISAILIAGLGLLASHDLVVHSSAKSAQTLCPYSPRTTGQDISWVEVDASRSTHNPQLRRDYAQAGAQIMEAAARDGKYVGVAVFAGSIDGVRTLCETSTRTAGTAPLFATAQETAMMDGLEKVVTGAASTRAAVPGTDVYGAVIAGVEHVQALRRGEVVSARLVILTDGDQAAQHLHLRRALITMSDEAIARTIIGRLPVPDASGVDIEIRGVGRSGVNRPLSTVSARRMSHIWTLVCSETKAKSCYVGPDLV